MVKKSINMCKLAILIINKYLIIIMSVFLWEKLFVRLTKKNTILIVKILYINEQLRKTKADTQLAIHYFIR